MIPEKKASWIVHIIHADGVWFWRAFTEADVGLTNFGKQGKDYFLTKKEARKEAALIGLIFDERDVAPDRHNNR